MHANDTMQYLSFSDLFHLGILPSTFTSVVSNGRIFFLLKAEYFPVWIHTIFSLSVSWWTLTLSLYLGYCEYCWNEHVKADIYLWWWFHISNGYVLRIGIAGSYRSSIFNFLTNLHAVFYSGYTYFHSHQWCIRIQFSLHPCQYLFSLVAGRAAKSWRSALPL